jgi:hypothetical protein
MLDELRPTSPEMDRAERGAEAAYERDRVELESDGDRQPERSHLDVATAFLGDHQVVELLQQGAVPLLTVSALRVGDEVKVVPTIHEEDGELIRVATFAALNACRAVIDGMDGEGEAAKALYCMRDPREQPGPDPEPPGDGVPHEEPEGDQDDDDDDE